MRVERSERRRWLLVSVGLTLLALSNGGCEAVVAAAGPNCWAALAAAVLGALVPMVESLVPALRAA